MVNLKFKTKRGFSLIELLISITIIGILATIILNSVSQSRARAYDSKIKQQLSSFRTAAAMYFNNTGSYGPETSDCNEGLFNDLTPANAQPGKFIDPANLPNFTEVFCGSNDSAYAVKATLSSGNEYWCVDNKGSSRLIPGIPTAGTFCP